MREILRPTIRPRISQCGAGNLYHYPCPSVYRSIGFDIILVHAANVLGTCRTSSDMIDRTIEIVLRRPGQVCEVICYIEVDPLLSILAHRTPHYGQSTMIAFPMTLGTILSQIKKCPTQSIVSSYLTNLSSSMMQ